MVLHRKSRKQKQKTRKS